MTEVYIHPSKILTEEELQLIAKKAPDFKIIQPSMDELEALCSMFPSWPGADTPEFWNPDHAFFVPRERKETP